MGIFIEGNALWLNDFERKYPDMEKISVIIHPSDEFITQVTVLKDQLKNEIGWYNSCHSRAHITVCELDSEEIELKEIKNQLTHISYRLQSKQVKFTSFNTFENGTFFYDAGTYFKTLFGVYFARDSFQFYHSCSSEKF